MVSLVMKGSVQVKYRVGVIHDMAIISFGCGLPRGWLGFRSFLYVFFPEKILQGNDMEKLFQMLILCF